MQAGTQELKKNKNKTNKKIKRFDENYKGSNKWLTALMESNRQ